MRCDLAVRQFLSSAPRRCMQGMSQGDSAGDAAEESADSVLCVVSFGPGSLGLVSLGDSAHIAADDSC
jgi:hypothetical protein